MANTTIASIILDNGANAVITENTSKKIQELKVKTIQGTDSTGVYVYGYEGSMRQISITGTFTGANIATLKTWVDSMDDLINGNQVSEDYPLLFVDDLRGTIKVKIGEFSSTKVGGNITKVDWTLKLVECSEDS